MMVGMVPLCGGHGAPDNRKTTAKQAGYFIKL